MSECPTLAAIALYRALLRQCSAVPLEDEQRYALKNVVRNKFRQNQHLQSWRYLHVAFKAGYEAIDILDAAAAGDPASTEKLSTLLSRISPRLQQSVTSRQPKSKAKNTVAAFRDTDKALDVRPHQVISGERQVSKLIDANRTPILRFKKPIPANLSRLIRNTGEQRIKRHDLLANLFGMLELANAEDKWDALVRKFAKRGKGRQDEGLAWNLEVRKAIAELESLMSRKRQKTMETAGRMERIIEQEEWLKEHEQRKKPGI